MNNTIGLCRQYFQQLRHLRGFVWYYCSSFWCHYWKGFHYVIIFLWSPVVIEYSYIISSLHQNGLCRAKTEWLVKLWQFCINEDSAYIISALLIHNKLIYLSNSKMYNVYESITNIATSEVIYLEYKMNDNSQKRS